MAPSISPSRTAPEPRIDIPLYRTPFPASTSKPTLPAFVPAETSALSTSVPAHWAMFGIRARTIAGAYFAFDVWNAWDPITRPMNRRIGNRAARGITARNSPVTPKKQIRAMTTPVASE